MTTQTATKTATISLEEMVNLKGKGLSLAQIGKISGISKQAVSQRLKASGLDPAQIGEFRKDKSLILHHKQKLLLDSLTQEEIRKMSGRDKVVSFGIIYDKTRLEDDKSTVNLAAFIANSEAIGESLKKLENTECVQCGVWTTRADVDAAGLCPLCRCDVKLENGTKEAPVTRELPP